MEELFPRYIKTKSKLSLCIREAQREDAAALLEHTHLVSGESDFLSFGQGEFKRNLIEEEAFIEDHLQAPNQLCIVAEINMEIIGLLTVKSSTKKRLQHIGEFGISIQKRFWGEGVGSQLVDSMIAWARQNELIRKLNLLVLANNTSAIHVYKKLGFEEEGLMRRASFQHGSFYDAYHMGMLID